MACNEFLPPVEMIENQQIKFNVDFSPHTYNCHGFCSMMILASASSCWWSLPRDYPRIRLAPLESIAVSLFSAAAVTMGVATESLQNDIPHATEVASAGQNQGQKSSFFVSWCPQRTRHINQFKAMLPSVMYQIQ